MIKMTLLIGLLLSLGLQAKVLIITDIDDTIKQTNVLNGFKAAMSTFGQTKAFEHMKGVFTEITAYHKLQNSAEKIEITYISGSIKCVTNQRKWIEKRKFPNGLIMQRRCNNGEFSYHHATKEFKVKAIASLLRPLVDGDHEIYLFGDSAEVDDSVYQEIQTLFPQFKYHAFIRDISARATDFGNGLKPIRVEGVNYFLTELDLYNFADFQFLSPQLKSSIEEDLKDDKLFPRYLDNNLARRLHKEAKLKKKQAKKLAKTILRSYYELH